MKIRVHTKYMIYHLVCSMGVGTHLLEATCSLRYPSPISSYCALVVEPLVRWGDEANFLAPCHASKLGEPGGYNMIFKNNIIISKVCYTLPFNTIMYHHSPNKEHGRIKEQDTKCLKITE